jgi:tetratricopeptide (TPR) repeat protein
MSFRFVRPLALVAALFLLGACDSAEERAEKHYQSALVLIESGDTDRALVELRNVFDLNGFHKEARKLYADTVLARGEVVEAYGQYLRLIEQYPDTPEVRLTLAELAIGRGDWDEAERHGREAGRLAPGLAGVPAVKVALDYRAAVAARDDAARQAAAEAARALFSSDRETRLARRVVIDHLVSGPAPLAAIPEIDRALETEPDAAELYGIKLRILASAGDEAAIGPVLKAMFERFPENQDVRGGLISWYLSQKDIDGAEAFLRQLAGPADGPPDGHLAVVQLLQAARDAGAAGAELDRLIAANDGTPNADIYRALKAGLDFEAGQQDTALAAMETILAAAEPSEQTRRIKVMLARMLESTGNRVGARARVEEVLAEDRTMTEALKMRAAWLIAEDKPGEAILDLRAALDQNPRDSGTLTLMAQAHERDGSLDLAGERLALAVDVSGSAPDESLRYARFLLQQGRTPAAESVLADARRVSPAHVGVLAQMADLFLAAQDWTRAQEIGATLRQIGTPEAATAAQALQAALLLGQGRTDDGIELLQGQIGEGDEGLRAIALIVQTQVRAGKLPEATAYLEGEMAKRPEAAQLKLLRAGLHALTGEAEAAEALFRDLVAEDPAAEAPARLLYGLLASADRAPEATAVLDAALAAQPASGTLRWMKAGELERAGDIEGAIAVYEALYAEDSSNVIVANNLASLIATHRTDPESLERAFAVARRLRGSDVPAFQDTYGWIEYRRGNLEEALADLEPAAADLPNDPLTQFHLGMTYAGLGRKEDAARVLTRAVELAGDSHLPQFVTARETLTTLPPPPPVAETPVPAPLPAPGPTQP